MTNNALVGVLVLLLVVIGVLGWHNTRTDDTSTTPPVVVDEGGDTNPTPEQCAIDIAQATEGALDQVCTLQFQEMTCPYDESVTHGAKNGCEISEFETLGWR